MTENQTRPGEHEEEHPELLSSSKPLPVPRSLGSARPPAHWPGLQASLASAASPGNPSSLTIDQTGSPADLLFAMSLFGTVMGRRRRVLGQQFPEAASGQHLR